MKKIKFIGIGLMFLFLAESCNWSKFYFRYRRSKRMEQVPAGNPENGTVNQSPSTFTDHNHPVTE